MYTTSINNQGSNKKKALLFADADNYTIPASEGWNEGYSQNNKFLYFKDVATRTKKNDDPRKKLIF
jgi:hypothetical protein